MFTILAAGDVAFTLNDTSWVVALGFFIFVGFLIWKKVPQLVLGLIDKRAASIRAELDEAKRLREEASEIYAEYEQRLMAVQEQADDIVASAKESAALAAKDARTKIKESVARRVEAGKEQIASAELAAERNIRNRASAIALQAANAVIAEKLAGKDAASAIDDAIGEVDNAIN